MPVQSFYYYRGSGPALSRKRGEQMYQLCLLYTSTSLEVVQAMIGTPGRNRLHIRAVWPDWVTLMIAAAFRSYAVVQVAWEMALVTSSGW